MRSPDICIAGAGIIGLTLARALRDRGLRVHVLDAGAALGEASSAAAGMLAVGDPHNPAALLSLAQWSRELYPALLASLAVHGGPAVRFQTERTLQQIPTSRDLAREGRMNAGDSGERPSPLSSFVELQEASLDPRELAEALAADVVASASIQLETATPVLSVEEQARSVSITTTRGRLSAGSFVDCTGAWSLSSAKLPALRVVPRKGQMLSVPTPPALAAGIVLRTEHVYLVPRLHGPRAGHTVIGATVEDVGFDRSVSPDQLATLLAQATSVLHELGGAQVLSSWSGLRPATRDLLPLLGRLPGSERMFLASGHYRNGILLAPGTADAMADLLTGKTPPVSLDAFSPDRMISGDPTATHPTKR